MTQEQAIDVTVHSKQAHAGGVITIVECQRRTFEIEVNTTLGTQLSPSEYQYEIREMLSGPDDMWDRFTVWAPYETLVTFGTPEEAYEDAVRIIQNEVDSNAI